MSSYDKVVNKATCNSTVSIESKDGELGNPEEIDFIVSPSSQDEDSFVISAPIASLRSTAQAAVTTMLNAQIETRTADAERARVAQENEVLRKVVTPRWLIGRWVDAGAQSGICVDGPYEEYRRGGAYGGYESSGAWRLSGVQLNVRGEAEGNSFSVDSTITAADRDSFSEELEDGKVYARRRCSADEMQESETVDTAEPV